MGTCEFTLLTWSRKVKGGGSLVTVTVALYSVVLALISFTGLVGGRVGFGKRKSWIMATGRLWQNSLWFSACGHRPG